MHFILFHDFYLSQSILCWNLSYLRNLLIKIVVLHSPKKLARASSPIHCKCSEVISGAASRQHWLNELQAITAFPLHLQHSKINWIRIYLNLRKISKINYFPFLLYDLDIDLIILIFRCNKLIELIFAENMLPPFLTVQIYNMNH